MKKINKKIVGVFMALSLLGAAFLSVSATSDAKKNAEKWVSNLENKNKKSAEKPLKYCCPVHIKFNYEGAKEKSFENDINLFLCLNRIFKKNIIDIDTAQVESSILSRYMDYGFGKCLMEMSILGTATTDKGLNKIEKILSKSDYFSLSKINLKEKEFEDGINLLKNRLNKYIKFANDEKDELEHLSGSEKVNRILERKRYDIWNKNFEEKKKIVDEIEKINKKEITEKDATDEINKEIEDIKKAITQYTEIIKKLDNLKFEDIKDLNKNSTIKLAGKEDYKQKYKD